MTVLALITLGGTISSSHGPSSEGVLPQHGGAAIASGISIPGAEIEAHEFRMLPSPSLGLDDTMELAALVRRLRERVDGVVVSQGTDTLEDTAFALDLLETGDRGALVVTGAMRSHGAHGADGPANLASALRLAASADAAGAGVLVAFADRVHAARWVTKSSTFAPDAFSSDPLGPIGWVAEDAAHIEFRPRPRPRVGIPSSPIPPIAVVQAGGGDELRLLDSIVADGYAGVVVAGLGGGHVADGAVDRVERLAARIPLVVASRVGSGPTLERSYGYVGGEIDLIRRGAIMSAGLTAGKSRVLLGVLLASGVAPGDVPDAFRRLA